MSLGLRREPARRLQNFDPDAADGEDGFAFDAVLAAVGPELVVDLEPGRYVLLCFLSDPEGVSHIERGMLREFVVEGDAAAAAAPKADATLSLGPGLTAPQVKAGERTLELRNDGDEPGSVFLTAFEPGKTEEDLTRWEENGLRGPAPATFLGG